jgi:hypothetical protein
VSATADEVVAEVVAEITDRLNAGEPVDIEACLARHPDRAEQLRPLLPALELLDRLGSSADAGDATGPRTDGPTDGITGVLGRGG